MSILVTRSSIPPIDEYINEIREMWDSHWLTNMGVKHKQLQRQLLEYLNVDNIELFVNGHMALEMSLQAMELSGEVITTPFTFASTAHAIVRNGLTPVFCDINPYDYTIDVKKIEELITDRTCAILPVHVYGNICDVEAIEKIANKYGLKVIYDAAHAFGETYKGISIANYGDASCFSFHATKVYNTIEGGAVAYRDEKFGRKLYDLKNFGIHGPDRVVAVGANAKMNEFCAAMGICNLRHVDDDIEKRKQVSERYFANLEDISGIKLPLAQKNVKSNYAYFPVVFDERISGVSREDIFDALEKEEVIARKYFYPIVTEFECYRDKYLSANVEIAKWVGDRVLTLPIYSDLELDVVDRISEIIIKALKKA